MISKVIFFVPHLRYRSNNSDNTSVLSKRIDEDGKRERASNLRLLKQNLKREKGKLFSGGEGPGVPVDDDETDPLVDFPQFVEAAPVVQEAAKSNMLKRLSLFFAFSRDDNTAQYPVATAELVTTRPARAAVAPFQPPIRQSPKQKRQGFLKQLMLFRGGRKQVHPYAR